MSAAVQLILASLSPADNGDSDRRGPGNEDRIAVVKSQLERARAKLDSLTYLKQTELEQLNTIDEQIELNSELLTRLDRRLRMLSGEENRLALDASQLDSALNRQTARLSVSLRNFYLRRRRPSDIVITSGDLVHAAGQILYTRKSVESLKAIINATDTLLLCLKDKSVKLQETRSQIDRYRTEIDLEKGLLQSQRRRRNRLMNSIRGEESLYREHLKQLEVDARAADSLFMAGGTASAESLFEMQKGKLPLPLRGKIIRAFGAIRDKETQTETFSSGIEIKGDLDSQIRAVYDGSVFHLGYLRGYGKVLILDHGGGWYTLYAHLSDYSVALGQPVKTGDVIGLLGASSVEGGPSLHFQIRHKRKQYDPVEWLRF